MNVESTIEDLAKQNIKDLIIGKYSALNECEKFKITQKLPTVLYFPKGEENKEFVEIDRLQFLSDHLNSSSLSDKNKRLQTLNEFVKRNHIEGRK